ncbi:MAG: DNA-processing protein DprA [Lachnospiraceae bacterium]|nr:DNA-processing protein DprA [Lachnospiraceae bacterium]
MDDNFYAFWLTYLLKIPTSKLWASVHKLGSVKSLYEANIADLEVLTEAEKIYFEQMRQRTDIHDKWLNIKGNPYQFLPYNSNLYPKRLLELKDAPFGIYYEGMEEIASLNERPVVAMVGARNCTIYGSELAYQIARELGRQGIIVVSGLAAGIDGASHRGCLDGGGFTLGVLGAGIHNVYPKSNYQLFIEMRKKGGILTEYPYETKPLPLLFPRRNRIISVLADFLVVIEAKEKSGSLITVDFALEQGKDIGAVPGRPCDIVSGGCNRLLQQGAKCILSAEDVLEELMDSGMLQKRRIEPTKVNTDLGLAPKEKMVYSCLRLEPKFIDEILCQLKLPVWEGIQILTDLEMKGIVQQNPHHYYYRKI